MEIVKISQGDCERYEELLLQREQLEKEADGYQIEYTREFGELLTDVFRMKLECIELKKAIYYCQLQKNKGETVDPQALEDYLKVHMAAYYDELNTMIAQKNAAKNATSTPIYEVNQVKKLYRKLAKLLHPDLSPLTAQYPQLMELFQAAVIAYRSNNLKRMEEIDVLAAKALKDLGVEQTEIVFQDIDRKISELEVEINNILTTEPYIYKDLLCDAFAMSEKKKALEEELESYKKYSEELKKHLEELAKQEADD